MAHSLVAATGSADSHDVVVADCNANLNEDFDKKLSKGLMERNMRRPQHVVLGLATIFLAFAVISLTRNGGENRINDVVSSSDSPWGMRESKLPLGNDDNDGAPRPIRQISILGERNSGTRWAWDHLSRCFNHSIPVYKNLTRYKHWFQYPNYTKYPHDTLVIAQFRNPYDWLKAMQHVPHHAPAHFKVQSDWKSFLEIPWTTKRVGSDLEITDDMTMCQEDFYFRDIVSCDEMPLPKSAYKGELHFSEDKPFYELRNDGSGEPYANIMEMRIDKILNFLSVKDYPGVADVWVVQYEYLIAVGTAHLLEKIEQYTGVKPKCEAYGAQQRRARPVTKAFAKYVNEYLNWTVEAMIGYGIDKQREVKWD